MFEVEKEDAANTDRGPLGLPLQALLLVVFFFVCCGLGYAILNRIDVARVDGLSDVRVYAAMVRSETQIQGHMQFRVLVPWLARPIYHLSEGRVGTWHPDLFALLVVDSFFTALTALLMVAIGARLRNFDYGIAMVAAFLYLVNYAVPHLRLAGYVDAAEGFFLLAVLWALLRQQYWLITPLAIGGALVKETFVPFVCAYVVGYVLTSKKRVKRSSEWVALAIGCSASIVTLLALHWILLGHYESLFSFAHALHGEHAYLHHIAAALVDRQSWYIFFWLLPLSLWRLRLLPRGWISASALGGGVAVMLDAYYGASPGTLGRALFTVCGPLLCLSAAHLLVRFEKKVVASPGV